MTSSVIITVTLLLALIALGLSVMASAKGEAPRVSAAVIVLSILELIRLLPLR